ncbi:pyridoxal-phosphate dependent enzyme [Desulfobacterota bacterium]|nr:pyridoxal-phosphate dependent enzyme [Thermodesulfobacteriota bacterium]NSX00488.1 pyridoxal-phosphate dependent enzyme [bacterium]|tara:strand:+ start:2772 stop:3695 length:924 start_codon:yes stop_codon:yes gene_type:complete
MTLGLENLNKIDSIIDLIGNTPLIKLNKFSELSTDKNIYIKAEWFNPGGSIKDRAALCMIKEGIKAGKLTKEKTIMDSSSGNTAIAYAMIGSALGFKVELVTPENINIERKKTLEAYGAKIIYSSPFEGSDGAILEARKLAKEFSDKYFMPDQYNNTANPLAHYTTTGPEIWEQTKGKITHLISGIGTSGTVMGTGRYLKSMNKEIKIVGVQPDEPLHGLEGLKHIPSSIVPGIYNEQELDILYNANTEESYIIMEKLMQLEGMFVGHSGGAVVLSALEILKETDIANIVCVVPDGGYRYLSGGVWW